MSSQWITLQQARDASYGKVAWWRLPAPNGERISTTTSDANEERLVWKGVTGTMYLGGWKSGTWNGLGVFYFPDGCVLSGYWDEGRLVGKAMHVLLPESPCWIENHWPRSSLLDPRTGTPLPFIYVGCYKDFRMNDDDAIVILKDGTTRRGPWKDNVPMGDWWKEHEETESVSWEQLSLLLSFDDEEEQETEQAVANSPHSETVVLKDYPPTVHVTTCVVSDSSPCSIASPRSWQSEEELEFQRTTESSITTWLMELLSPDANPHEMQYYASRFYQDGFHSVTYIQQYCSTSDLRSWMKKAHVRVVSQQLVSEKRVQTIALWLHKIVFHGNVHAWEAHEYATQLVDEGLHSIADTREFCTIKDVESFHWMKPFHKRRLMAQLEQYIVR